METKTPSLTKIFGSLLKADAKVQWRNRRASFMSLLVPIFILISWKSIVEAFGGAFAFSSCITIGLVATGLMGYANTTARDREKGIFQRLRVTPASTFAIMTSRIIIQLCQMGIMTILVFIAGYFLDGILLTSGGYIFGFIGALLCGAVFLSLGLMIVGLIPSAETVNSVTRFVYIALVFIGAIGELGVLGSFIQEFVLWSPYGTVKVLLLATMLPSTWSLHTTLALIITTVYTCIFAGIGIKWFKWNTN